MQFIQTMACTPIIDFQHLLYIYLVTPGVSDGCISFDIVCLCVCVSVTTLTTEIRT